MTKLILAASAAILIAGPAFAETAGAAQDAPSVAVSTKGVDFANREQVRRFYTRLRGAIAEVCGAGSQADASCVRDVTAQAVRAANKPVLTALYDSQGGNRAFAGNDQ